MVDVKSGDGEPGHPDGQDEGHDGYRLVLGVADHQENVVITTFLFIVDSVKK